MKDLLLVDFAVSVNAKKNAELMYSAFDFLLFSL